MPKVARKHTSSSHTQSAKPTPTQQSFAVQDNAVEHIDLGVHQDIPANEILEALGSNPDEMKNVLKKKEKKALRHEAFVERLASAITPYHSKSHARRQKRKMRDQLGTGMSSVEEALAEAVGAVDSNSGDDPTIRATTQPPSKSLGALISKGRGSTLTAKQRKRALELERARQPAILKNPSFHSNPFETIRIHASNSLVKHEPPAVS